MTDDTAAAIQEHYRNGDLAATILDALRAAGKDIENLEPADLAPLDQLHTGGSVATLELAALAKIEPGWRVLDIGGGFGGAARMLAKEFGVTVEVIDLSEQFVEAGRMLTERTGMSGRVTLRVGDASALPYEGSSFDLVWTQHAMMNIQAKQQVYTEAARVLRPGGRLAFHDILAGDGRPLHFPVMWAADQTISFLATPDETKAMLRKAGLREVMWADVTVEARAMLGGMLAAGGPPPLGVHLIIRDSAARLANICRNIDEGRAVVVQAVYERP